MVEQGYLSGAVSVLCCTPTMAVGVNLPARRVVFYRCGCFCLIVVGEFYSNSLPLLLLSLFFTYN